MPVVIGTAGHIDHGKTALIKALTGVDPDRLQEEKRRGITIELGFSHLVVPNGRQVSIIDVPGHERFIKQMVSGIAGIDFLLLVVAADEGIMPQTREHLEISSLFNISQGLVVITKVDLIDREWLALVTEETKKFLRGSFLENAPIFQVSSRTGEGIDQLRDSLLQLSSNFKHLKKNDIPRLPIDRIFSIKGHGTVVTGTLVTGTITQGETLCLMPSGKTGKVRMLQSHGKNTPHAPAGHRTAVNLGQLEVAEIERGEVLSLPGKLFPSTSWLTNLYCLPSSPKPLKNRMEVHFHHGTKETQAKIYFFERKQLQQGDSTLCQIIFTEPMLGVSGDNFIIRSFSPLLSVGGGEVLFPIPAHVHQENDNFQHIFSALQRLSWQVNDPDPQESIIIQLDLCGKEGASYSKLCALVNCPSSEIQATLQELCRHEIIFLFDTSEQQYISAKYINELASSYLDWLKLYHAKEPKKQGAYSAAMISDWGKKISPKLVSFLRQWLASRGDIIIEKATTRLPWHEVKGETPPHDELSKYISMAGKNPPNITEILTQANITSAQAAPMLRVLLDSKQIIKVTDQLYYSTAIIEEFKQKLYEYFTQDPLLSPAKCRDLLSLSSRKYSMALLTYFSKIQVIKKHGSSYALQSRDT